MQAKQKKTTSEYLTNIILPSLFWHDKIHESCFNAKFKQNLQAAIEYFWVVSLKSMISFHHDFFSANQTLRKYFHSKWDRYINITLLQRTFSLPSALKYNTTSFFFKYMFHDATCFLIMTSCVVIQSESYMTSCDLCC